MAKSKNANKRKVKSPLKYHLVRKLFWVVAVLTVIAMLFTEIKAITFVLTAILGIQFWISSTCMYERRFNWGLKLLSVLIIVGLTYLVHDSLNLRYLENLQMRLRNIQLLIVVASLSMFVLSNIMESSDKDRKRSREVSDMISGWNWW